MDFNSDEDSNESAKDNTLRASPRGTVKISKRKSSTVHSKATIKASARS